MIECPYYRGRKDTVGFCSLNETVCELETYVGK